MKRLIDVEICTVAVRGQTYRRLEIGLLNPASRIARLIDAVKADAREDDVSFVHQRMEELAAKVRAGDVPLAATCEVVSALQPYGYFDLAEGQSFLTSLWNTAISRPPDLAGFEALAKIARILPGSYSQGDLDHIRASYLNFAREHADEYSNGYYDDRDPSVVRDDVYRLGSIDKVLAVDTSPLQKTLNDYADDREQAAEENREPYIPDADDKIEEVCTNAELEGMFSTLEDCTLE